MRGLLIVAAAAGLAGCQGMERSASLMYGMLRVEPHPQYADSVRIVTQITMGPLDPLGRGTPEGPRNVTRSALGDRCADAPIIEEGRVRLAGDRWFAALRVICPAARG